MHFLKKEGRKSLKTSIIEKDKSGVVKIRCFKICNYHWENSRVFMEFLAFGNGLEQVNSFHFVWYKILKTQFITEVCVFQFVILLLFKITENKFYFHTTQVSSKISRGSTSIVSSYLPLPKLLHLFLLNTRVGSMKKSDVKVYFM